MTEHTFDLDYAQPVIPASTVIPGSEIQKRTAISQGTLPEAPDVAGWDASKMILGLGGVLTGMAAGAGGKGAEAALHTQALMDGIAAKRVVGYMSQLQAAVGADPSLAPKAYEAFQKFISDTGVSMPKEVGPFVERTLATLKSAQGQILARDAAVQLATMPNATDRMKTYARLVNPPDGGPGMSHEQAVQIAHLLPDTVFNFETHIDWKRNRMVTVDKRTGQVTGQHTLDGTAMPDDPMTTENALRLGWGAPLAKRNMSIPAFVDKLNRGEPSAIALQQTLTLEAEAEAKRLREEGQRARITPTQAPFVPVTARERKVQYWEDMSQSEQAQFLVAQDRHATKQALALEIAKGNDVAFDLTTMRVLPPTEQTVQAVLDGQARTLPAAEAKEFKAINSFFPQLDKLLNLSNLVLTQKVGGGQNLLQALKLAVGRGLMTNEDAALFRAISGPLGLELTKMYQGSRPSDLDLKAARMAIPVETDNFGVAARKIDFLRGQLLAKQRATLDINVGNVFDTPNKFATQFSQAFPELSGRLGPSLDTPIKPGSGVPGTEGTNARKVRRAW